MDNTEKIINEFAAKIRLEDRVIRAVLPCCREILEKGLAEYAALRLDPENEEAMRTLAEKLNRSMDEVCLGAAILIGAASEELYREKGLSEQVYIDSMGEIRIWEKTCEKEFHCIGLREYGWVSQFLKAGIIRLGRLEFHEIHYGGKKVWEGHGVTVKPGDRVINMHIPEDGPLMPEAVEDAIRQAYAYFGCRELQAFVCESWLLYPGFYDFLPESSNIRKFMDIFDIAEYENVQNDGDLWRVFGHRESYVPAELPRETALQRGLADYLAAHDNVTGWGLGVFISDGERILPKPEK